MVGKIELECRVQYLRSGKWVTITEDEEVTLIVESEIVDLLERWAGWFEARQFQTAERGLCAVCLHDVSEQGHSSDCIFAMTTDALDNWREREGAE